MSKQLFLYAALLAFLPACNNTSSDEASTNTDTTNKEQPVAEAKMPDLPSYVVFKNWEMGDPDKTRFILDVYEAWDGKNPGTMSSYFADSTIWDFPDGKRVVTTSQTVESTVRKWRSNYKETSNIPISLISLRNKDMSQEWVIAWTWNKWREANGVKDSMLYCDNWQIKNGKIIYLNSMQNRASKSLSMRLNELASK